MGNSVITLRIKYGCKELNLDYRSLDSFNSTKRQIKQVFEIDDKTPIVIKSESLYISTPYKWKKLPLSKDLELEVWPQVETFIQEGFYSRKLIPQIFKLQKKKSEKIVSLGLFISKNCCIIPSLEIDEDNLEDLIKFKIVFFDEREINLDLNIKIQVIGASKSIQKFILIAIDGQLGGDDDWAIQLPENTERIRGQVIYFNSQTEMLTGYRCDYHEIDKNRPFKIRVEKIDWIPGGIFVSDKGEVIGICTGEIGGLFYPTNIIFRELSNLLERVIDEGDDGLRNILLDINNIEYKLPGIMNIKEWFSLYEESQFEIVNPLQDIFSLDA